MHSDETKPLWATLGSYEPVEWSDALVGFTTFFHNWFKGVDADEATRRMRVASGHDGFVFFTGEKVKADYREFLLKGSLDAFIAANRQITSAIPEGTNQAS